MLATLAALVVSAAPAHLAPELSVPLVLTKKKKKRPPAKPGEKEPPAETSEGLDLTEDASTPAPAEAPPEPVAVEAAPPPKPPPAWAAVTAHTAGEGGNLVFAEVGWPGVAAGYWRGILGALDVGARVGFNWSYEGLLTRPVLGMRFQVQARYLVFESGGLALSVHLSPGGLVYFFAGGPRGGLIVPIGATLDLPFELVSKLKLSVALEVPVWVLFGVGAVVPIVAGVHAEYPLTDSLVAFVKLKPAGIAIWTNGAGIFYTFEGLAGVAFHL